MKMRIRPYFLARSSNFPDDAAFGLIQELEYVNPDLI